LREICPPKKRTPKSGPNIGAIAGELLTHNIDRIKQKSSMHNTIHTIQYKTRSKDKSLQEKKLRGSKSNQLQRLG
jgi:hypothetical protein